MHMLSLYVYTAISMQLTPAKFKVQITANKIRDTLFVNLLGRFVESQISKTNVSVICENYQLRFQV